MLRTLQMADARYLQCQHLSGSWHAMRSNSRGLVEKVQTIKDRIDANGALANNAYGSQNIFFPSVRHCLLRRHLSWHCHWHAMMPSVVRRHVMRFLSPHGT